MQKTKKQIIQDVKIIVEEMKEYKNDSVAICMIFNNYTDALCKDKLITTNQYNRYFLTKRELKSILYSI